MKARLGEGRERRAFRRRVSILPLSGSSKQDAVSPYGQPIGFRPAKPVSPFVEISPARTCSDPIWLLITPGAATGFVLMEERLGQS